MCVRCCLQGSDIETLGHDVGVDYDPEETAGASAPELLVSSLGSAPDVVLTSFRFRRMKRITGPASELPVV